MKSVHPRQLSPITTHHLLEAIPVADDAALDVFARWLDGQLEELVDRWSAWTTARSARASERGVYAA